MKLVQVATAAAAILIQTSICQGQADGDVSAALLQLNSKSLRQDTYSATSNAELSAAMVKVSTCFDDEAARMRLHAAGEIGSGFITAGFNGFATSLEDNPVLAGAVQATGDSVSVAVDGTLKIAETYAENCHQSAAKAVLEGQLHLSGQNDNIQKTLNKLSSALPAKIDESVRTISLRIEESEKRLAAGISGVMTQSLANNAKMSRMESRLGELMRDNARVQLHIVSQLDKLAKKVLEGIEKTEGSLYTSLSVSFASSLTGVSDAWSDIESVGQERANYNSQLLVLLRSGESPGPWLQNLPLENVKAKARLADIWDRARQHFNELVALTVEGSFFDLHYKMSMTSVAEKWMSETVNNFQCNGVFATIDGLGNEMATVLQDDVMLPSIVIAAARMVGIEEIVLGRKPSAGNSALVRQIESLTSKLVLLKSDLSLENGKSLMESMLGNLLPIHCPVNQHYSSAAIHYGFINSDEFVQLDSDTIAQKPASSMRNNVYKCVRFPDLPGRGTSDVEVFLRDVTDGECNASFRKHLHVICPKNHVNKKTGGLETSYDVTCKHETSGGGRGSDKYRAYTDEIWGRLHPGVTQDAYMCRHVDSQACSLVPASTSVPELPPIPFAERAQHWVSIIDGMRAIQWPEASLSFKVIYPNVGCPSISERQCRNVLGYTFQSVLNNDANWIDGCFEWHESKKLYYNNRNGATTGNVGGNRICDQG